MGLTFPTDAQRIDKMRVHSAPPHSPGAKDAARPPGASLESNKEFAAKLQVELVRFLLKRRAATLAVP
ncbi:hypothetical protein S1OALGB6SA_1499 [Olavius algarvensis spirochete endosymbiont]|nr:hypothetical protein S1OALGB6SA_1499 [Olavius algarvensis spirochete endosymbiont]